MKVVINHCFGGFSISKAAAKFMAKRGNKQAQAELSEDKEDWYGFGYTEDFNKGYKRTDIDLIAAVETLGEKANGCVAKLRVVEIPDNIKWKIDCCDGLESISEEHQEWC